MAKKYNYHDHFEFLYLRHEYLEKCDNLNGEYVEEFEPIVKTTARLMYDKLYPNFNKVGFDLDDIVEITNIYMLCYMSLYSIRNNKDEYEKFIKKWQEKHHSNDLPSDSDVNRTERNHLINFLRQRLQHCSTVCARKARNITVGKDKHGYFAYTKDSQPVSQELILNNYKKYGFRKVTNKEYKEAKKRADNNQQEDLYDKDGYPIIFIQMLNNGIDKNDYSNILDSTLPPEFKDPETAIIEREDEQNLSEYIEKFHNLQDDEKKELIDAFIRNNKNNKALKKELRTAKKMLKDIHLWYDYIHERSGSEEENYR